MPKAMQGSLKTCSDRSVLLLFQIPDGFRRDLQPVLSGNSGGRTSKECVQIFFSGRALCGIHPVIDKIHVQIVPGDVINFILRTMTKKICGYLCIALR